MTWNSIDPRDIINKRDTIVVCAPEGEVFKAEVETKHGWCIFLRRERPDKSKLISEHAPWPPEWRWAFAPKGW